MMITLFLSELIQLKLLSVFENYGGSSPRRCELEMVIPSKNTAHDLSEPILCVTKVA